MLVPCSSGLGYLRHSRMLPRPAFSLTELLVALSILAVLIALLVPAVQKMRAAASRFECENNLKQIGAALHGYHDVYNRFPPGGARDQIPFGTSGTAGSGWGASWLAYILPYMEQGSLYGRLEFSGGSGWNNPVNALVISNVVIDGYRCPASLLPLTCDSPTPDGNAFHVMAANYVGIAGADTAALPTEKRVESGSSTVASGRLSAGGVLFPNSQIATHHILDGTSNTFLVSEQAAFLTSQNGDRLAWSASSPYGWLIGAGGTGTPPNYGCMGDNRAFNVATIRYLINHKSGWTVPEEGCDLGGLGGSAGPAGIGASSGVSANGGQNIPLNSTHEGGVNVLLCDGSVRFVSSATPLPVLGMLATRDDGLVIPDY